MLPECLVFLFSALILSSGYSQNLNITCDGTTCTKQCNDYKDCSGVIIDMKSFNKSVDTFNIECIGDYSCELLTFHENESAQNVSTTIQCLGLRSCSTSKFYLSNNRNISIECGAKYQTCNNMRVYCENCTAVGIEFKDSCTNSQIDILCYHRDKLCNIHCGYTHNFDVYTNTNSINIITESSTCIDQQFSCFLPDRDNETSLIEKELQCLSDLDPFNFNTENTSIITKVEWNINYLENCTSSYSTEIICEGNDYGYCSIECDYDYRDNTSLCKDLILSTQSTDVFNLHCNEKSCIGLIIDCRDVEICNIYCNHQEGHGKCMNFTIYINDANKLNLQCSPGYGCSSSCESIIIYAENVENIIMNCSNNVLGEDYGCSACIDIEMHAMNVANMMILCILDYTDYYDKHGSTINYDNYRHKFDQACGYLNITDINNVESMTVKAIGKRSIFNSSINAMNVKVFNVTAYSLYGEGNVINNSSLYLSPFENIFIFEGNPFDDVNLYSIKDVINSNKMSVSINGCDQCFDAKDCIKGWKLYCNFETIQHLIECKDNTELIQIIDENFINDYLICTPKYDGSFNNDTMYAINTTFSIIAIIFLIFWALYGLYDLCDTQTKKRKNEFVSNRPKHYILFGTFIADIILTLFIFWICIKSTILYKTADIYCQTKFPNLGWVENFYDNCYNDNWCQIWNEVDSRYIDDYTENYGYYGSSFDFYRECLRKLTNKQPECKCVGAEGIFAITVTLWVVFGVFVILEILRFAAAIRYDSKRHGGIRGDMISQFSMGCMCCRFCGGIDNIHFLFNAYWNRKFWCDINDCCNLWNCQYFCYFVMNILCRWLIMVIIGTISVGLYSNVKNTDFEIKGYEIFPVLVIILLRMIIHFYYSKGAKYVAEREWAPQILEILNKEFVDDITKIIKFYMPLFYDEDKCHPDYLVDCKEIELQSMRRG